MKEIEKALLHWVSPIFSCMREAKGNFLAAGSSETSETDQLSFEC